MVIFVPMPGGFTAYVGRDKHENEVLLKNGWPEDVWFHVAKLSSAHVYLRLAPGADWRAIPEAALEACCQLVCDCSIEGRKLERCRVVITPFHNLKKTGDMEAGQVAFHRAKECKYVWCEKDRAQRKALERAASEDLLDYDFNGARLQRDRDEAARERSKRQRDEAESRSLAKERSEAAALRRYEGFGFDDDSVMMSNANMSANYEDDFM